MAKLVGGEFGFNIVDDAVGDFVGDLLFDKLGVELGEGLGEVLAGGSGGGGALQQGFDHSAERGDFGAKFEGGFFEDGGGEVAGGRAGRALRRRLGLGAA